MSSRLHKRAVGGGFSEPQPEQPDLAVERLGVELFVFVGRLDRHEEMAERHRRDLLKVTAIKEFSIFFSTENRHVALAQ